MSPILLAVHGVVDDEVEAEGPMEVGAIDAKKTKWWKERGADRGKGKGKGKKGGKKGKGKGKGKKGMHKQKGYGTWNQIQQSHGRQQQM